MSDLVHPAGRSASRPDRARSTSWVASGQGVLAVSSASAGRCRQQDLSDPDGA